MKLALPVVFALGCTHDATSSKRPTTPPDTGTSDSGPPTVPIETAQTTGDTGAVAAPRPCGLLQSAVLIGGTDTSTQLLAIDSEGGLYSGGHFSGTLAFDVGGPLETTLVGAAASDGMLIRYAPDGSFAWARHFSTSYSTAPEALAVTSDGGVVVVGAFYESFTAAEGQPDAVTLTSAGESDGYVARFDADGGLLWAVRLGGASHDFPTGLGLLADDSVMLTGLYRADLTLGPGEPGETVLPLHPYADESGFVARLDPGGALDWAVRFGGTTSARADGAAMDTLTQELVIGGFIGGFGVAELPTVPPSFIDPVFSTGFVARFDAEGVAHTISQFGGFPSAVGAAEDGSVVVSGDFYAEATFGAGEANEITLSSGANTDAFVARFDDNGALLWAAQSLSPPGSNTSGRAAASASDGTVLLVGDFTSEVGFDPGGPNATLLSTRDSYDPYVAQFDATGAFVCATHIAGVGSGIGAGVAFRPDGTFVVTGDLGGLTTFAAGTPQEVDLAPSGEEDGYLATFVF